MLRDRRIYDLLVRFDTQATFFKLGSPTSMNNNIYKDHLSVYIQPLTRDQWQ